MPITIKKPTLLLVEGKDEVNWLSFFRRCGPFFHFKGFMIDSP